jgi:hypothetical protein
MSWCERIASGETHRDDDSGVLPDGLPCRARLGESEEEGALHFFCMKRISVPDGLPRLPFAWSQDFSCAGRRFHPGLPCLLCCWHAGRSKHTSWSAMSRVHAGRRARKMICGERMWPAMSGALGASTRQASSCPRCLVQMWEERGRAMSSSACNGPPLQQRSLPVVSAGLGLPCRGQNQNRCVAKRKRDFLDGMLTKLTECIRVHHLSLSPWHFKKSVCGRGDHAHDLSARGRGQTQQARMVDLASTTPYLG